MPLIKKDFIERVTDRSKSDAKDLVEIIASFAGSEPRKEGASYKTACPLCGSEHSLVITPGKQVFKCFNCNGLQGKTPLDYLMKGQSMSYTETIEWLASHYNMVVEYEEPVKKEPTQKKKGKTFCARMLEDSGLTVADITATVKNETAYKRPTFHPGTINNRGEIDESGDDAIIRYYDLDGHPIKYTVDKDKTATEREYYRVRYQFPSEHTDRNGKEMKYRSPSGAPTFVYFPQKIRSLYQAAKPITTLYIQEGEKKAEKACKHGIDSVAVSGIQNLGHKGSLPEEIIKLIEVCKVREVIFLLDSDCFDLTHHIKVDDPIDRRPKNFFYAVKNYKEYFNKLKNRELYVELYFGYVLKNEKDDKGIDDLLTNTLKGKEDDLLNDITTAKNEKHLTGQYVKLHKITTITDSKLQEIWCLHNNKEFCQRYIEQLKDLPEFTIGKRRMRFNEKGELESAQPVEPDEQFWTVINKKDGTTDYNFCYTGAELFLEHRGFFRYKRLNGEYDYIKVEHPFVRTVKHVEVGDYVRSFTKDCLPKQILEMLYRGGSQYLGPDKLTMLDYFEYISAPSHRGVQRFYFADKWWQITSEGINTFDYSQTHFHIWAEDRKEFNAPELQPLIKVNTYEDGYRYEVTEAGKHCHFLQYLINASNFTWRKDAPEPEELADNAQHLINKLAAFGYLVASVKDKSCCKAVVGMDGKQSDIGESNGRSGKSLLGEAVKVISCTRHYNGKEFSTSGTRSFLWDGINEKTKCVFIDDCMKDFDFEILFSLITGEWPVNPKGEKPYILPFQKSPKIYVTTNHTMRGDGSSFIDRQWLIAFSDYYNDTHKPIDDFGVLFFDEWDSEQWDLFWNLVAQCVQIYFRYGYVSVPGDRLEKRKLQAEIGDEFIQWADEYYSDESKFNQRLARKEIYDALLEYVGPNRRQFYTTQRFSKCLFKWCKLREYIFNPQLYDPINGEYIKKDDDGRGKKTDKSNGTEYFTIGDMSFYSSDAIPNFSEEIKSDDLIDMEMELYQFAVTEGLSI